MKKISLICLAIFSFLMLSINAYAAPNATLSVSNGTIENGNKVTATLTIKNVASWQVTIASSGATSGCTQTFSDVTSDGENTTKKLSVTCKSTSTGTINFVASGNATSSDGSKVQITTSKKVTVVTPREKSKNNKLKSLSIDGYELSPSFSKDVNEYTVNVPSTVNKINIKASKADTYSSIEGTGEKTIEEGTNTFEIIVTSETGVSNTYKINVNVEDQNPINVKVKDKNYTLVKIAKNLTKPELFEETTIKINDFDIPAFINNISDFTLVGLKDEEGKIELYIYKNNEYTKYENFVTNSNTIIFMTPNIIPENFVEKTLLINERETTVYTDGKTELVYGINLLTGKKNYYSYEKTENTLQIYKVNSSQEKTSSGDDKYLVYALSVGVLLLLLLVMLLSSKCSKLSKLVKLNEKIKSIKEEKLELFEKIEKEETIKKNKKNGKKK